MSKLMELADAYAEEQRNWGNGSERTRIARAALEAELAKVVKDAAQHDAVWMDAKRLAMELECLLMSCELPACSKWWDSAHEALELHRQLIQETYSAMENSK